MSSFIWSPVSFPILSPSPAEHSLLLDWKDSAAQPLLTCVPCPSWSLRNQLRQPLAQGASPCPCVSLLASSPRTSALPQTVVPPRTHDLQPCFCRVQGALMFSGLLHDLKSPMSTSWELEKPHKIQETAASMQCGWLHGIHVGEPY